jgi:hypothetical protein
VTIILLLTAMATSNLTCFLGTYIYIINRTDFDVRLTQCQGLHFILQSTKHFELTLTALVDWKEETTGHILFAINQFNFKHLLSSVLK